VKKEFSANTISGILHVAMSNGELDSGDGVASRLAIVIEVVKGGGLGMGMLEEER